jgi:hypothetical protein
MLYLYRLLRNRSDFLEMEVILIYLDLVLISIGTQADSVFSGISTFGRIPYRECFGRDKHEKFDIAILGAPFDTGTSYRYVDSCLF